MRRTSLCTEAEIMTLQEWSFFEDFTKWRTHFVALMRGLLQGASQMPTSELPTDVDIAKWLKILLEKDVIFDRMIRDKLYIRAGRVQVFRSMFARFAASEAWEEVVS